MDDLRKTRWFSWTRLAGLAVTAGLFYFIFQKVKPEVLLDSFQRLHPAWALGAFVLYGLGLFLGGLRWHCALRLIERTVHAGASIRLLYVGHFFFVALFGAAGGDVAKSVVYSRWFRFSLPEVLAAAPLDRGLGSFGTLFIMAATTAFAFLTGGFEDLTPVRWEWRNTLWFFVAGALVLLVVGLFFWKPQQETPWTRGLRTLKSGVLRLGQIPHLGGKALACSVVHQTAIISVFALNLMAVSPDPLPWAHIAWTMPAISALSCFPISIAGAGVREVAAISLLGLYGVPAGDCAAAAMLTLLVKLTWAGAGGWIFWRERQRQRQCQHRPVAQSISAIVPTFNEARYLPETLARLQRIPEVREIIVVDGGSTDRTIPVAEEHKCRVLRADAGRGGQLRLGAARAKQDVVLLLHADTWLPAHAGRAILDCLRDNTVVGGGHWKTFRRSPLLLRGSRFKCAIRLWLWKRVTGDQALFARREVLERIGGVPDMPLMEEFALCERLRAAGRLALAGANIQTSARRFRKHGALRTYLLMSWIHLLYRLGYSSADLKRIYEKGRLALPPKKTVGARS